jgi:glycosyltransferase involved in cell wall biosynthesis
MISLVIPSYNNLKHLKNAYTSIKKHAPEAEIVLLDDGSTDGTWDWITEVSKTDNKIIKIRWTTRVGHTILYDVGIREATNEIVGILHADMILGPHYVENMIKHLRRGKVVCATRVEPPLHPEGNEKIIKDFGLDFDRLNVKAFELYCEQAQIEFKDVTSKGMFAPWILYKSDFQSIGGHDSLFAPFPYEDSDIFQRWILAGYELIQSRDAFVYHLTCRGHRWNDKVGTDDDYYKWASRLASRNYLRKWGSWIKNDEYQYPIVPFKYNIAFVVRNCNVDLLGILEPWCDRIYVENKFNYIESEQPNTKFDLTKRVLYINENSPDLENDIVVEFDAKNFTNSSFNIIQNLSDIITDSGDIGFFELDCFKIEIISLQTYEHTLIHNKNTSI